MKQISVWVFFLLNLVATRPSLANPEITKSLSLHYSTVMNTQDFVSEKQKSRYLIEISAEIRPPEQISTNTTTSTNDNGWRRDITTVIGTGPSLIQVKTQVTQIDEAGKVLQKYPEQVSIDKTIHLYKTNDSQVAVAPVGQFFGYSTDLNPGVLSLTGFISINAYFHQTKTGYVLDGYEPDRSATGMSLKESFAMAYFSQLYETIVGIPEGEPTDLTRCEKPGESVELRDFPIGSIKIHRIEYCYPTPEPLNSQHFTRMVLAIDKPPTPKLPNYSQMHDYLLQDLPLPGPQPLLIIPAFQLAAMNCHGYSLAVALGKALDLPRGATWIEGLSSQLSEGTTSFSAIVHKHFDLMARLDKIDFSYDEREQRAQEFHSLLSQARAGDLIAFSDGRGYLHSGILIQMAGSSELWVQSKYEQDEVVTTPLENIGRVYDYTTVEVFRRK